MASCVSENSRSPDFRADKNLFCTASRREPLEPSFIILSSPDMSRSLLSLQCHSQSIRARKETGMKARKTREVMSCENVANRKCWRPPDMRMAEVLEDISPTPENEDNHLTVVPGGHRVLERQFCRTHLRRASDAPAGMCNLGGMTSRSCPFLLFSSSPLPVSCFNGTSPQDHDNRLLPNLRD